LIRKGKENKNRFMEIVKAYGDFETYIQISKHPSLFIGKDQLNECVAPMTLAEAISKVTGKKCSGLGCENAKLFMEMMNVLLGMAPTYSNFFSHFMFATGSRAFCRLSSKTPVRHYKKRRIFFTCLQRYLSEKLYEFENSIFVLGLDTEAAAFRFTSKAEWWATGIIRALLSYSIDMDHLYKEFKNGGVAALDRKLETEYLKRCLVGQSEVVVSQINQSAKLIRQFFLDHGHQDWNTMNKREKLTIYKPCQIPTHVWSTFEPLVEYFVAKFENTLTDIRLSRELRLLISMLIRAGFDHNKLYYFWRTDKNFEVRMANKLSVEISHLSFSVACYFTCKTGAKFLVDYFCSQSKLEPFKAKHLWLDEKINERLAKEDKSLDKSSLEEDPLISVPDPKIFIWEMDQMDVLQQADKALSEMLPKMSDVGKIETYTANKKSLTAILKYVEPKIKSMIFVLNGRDYHVKIILNFLHRFLAYSNMNFVTLKSLHRTNTLDRELYKVLWKNKPINFPLFDAYNLAALISSYFSQFSLSMSS